MQLVSLIGPYPLQTDGTLEEKALRNMFLQRNTSTYQECLLTTNETLSIYLLVSNFGAITDNIDMCPNPRTRNSEKLIYSQQPGHSPD